MAKIFSLMGEILVDNTNANKAIDETTNKGKDQAKTFGEKFGDVTKTVGKVATAVVGTATSVVGGLMAMANKTAEYAGTMNDASKKTSLSTDLLQQLKYAGDQSGVSFEDLTGSAVKFNKVFADAATGNKNNIKTFSDLGVAIKDSSGKARSSSDVYNDVIMKLAKMGDTAEANALGNDIFGKSFANLKPLLAEGAGGIQAFKDKANELGIVMSEDAVQAGDNFADSFDTIKAALGGAFAKLGSAVIPVLQKVIDIVIQNMPMIQKMIDTLAPILVSTLDAILPVLLDFVNMILPILLDLFNQLLPPLSEIIKALLPIFTQLLQILLPPLIKIIEALLPVLLPIIQALLPLLTPLLDILAWMINNVLMPIINVITSIANVLSKVLVGAIKILTPVIKGLLEIFKTVFGAIANVVKAPINFIIDGINLFIKMLNKIKIPDWVPAVGGKGFNLPTIPKLKVGLDYVPYDDFNAILHRGERVLTAEQNSQYSKDNNITKSNSVINNFIIDKIEVKKENDVELIAEELYYLQKKAVA